MKHIIRVFDQSTIADRSKSAHLINNLTMFVPCFGGYTLWLGISTSMETNCRYGSDIFQSLVLLLGTFGSHRRRYIGNQVVRIIKHQLSTKSISTYWTSLYVESHSVALKMFISLTVLLGVHITEAVLILPANSNSIQNRISTSTLGSLVKFTRHMQRQFKFCTKASSITFWR